MLRQIRIDNINYEQKEREKSQIAKENAKKNFMQILGNISTNTKEEQESIRRQERESCLKLKS